MKAQEICLGVVMLTPSVLNNNIVMAVELQMDGKVENFYLNISKQSQQNDKHKRTSDLRQLSYLKLIKQYMFQNTKATFPSLCTFMCHKSDNKGFMSLEHHGTSMKGSPQVSSLKNDRNSQLENMSRLFPYHAA